MQVHHGRPTPPVRRRAPRRLTRWRATAPATDGPEEPEDWPVPRAVGTMRTQLEAREAVGVKIVVLGAGIVGVSSAYFLAKDSSKNACIIR